jgi:hypothetical protein
MPQPPHNSNQPWHKRPLWQFIGVTIVGVLAMVEDLPWLFTWLCRVALVTYLGHILLASWGMTRDRDDDITP